MSQTSALPQKSTQQRMDVAPAGLSAFFDAPGPDMSIVERVRSLQGPIRSKAKESEDQRRVCEEVVQAIQAQRLFHVSVPKRLGGLGGNFRTFIETVAEIGRADGGTGWATALLNVCTWFASLFGEQAQAEAFGPKGDTRICGIFTHPARNEKVAGGLRVSGEWGYGSGSAHAQWATLGVKLGENPDGSPIPGLALVPMSDLTIKDTWYVAGMSASGSNTLVANDIFIPQHRIQSFIDMAAGDYARTPSAEPNDYASFIPVAEIILVAVQLGLTRAAIDITLQKGATKAVSYTIFNQMRTSPAHQIELANAVSTADQAHLLVARACADIDRAAAHKTKMDSLTRARVRMDTGQAGKLCREAINRLMSINGAGSFALANPLQRIWRDSEIASRHAFVLPEMANLIYGRALFDIPEIVQIF